MTTDADTRSKGSESRDDTTPSHLAESAVIRADLDAVALKPTECDVKRALDIPLDTVTIDFEGTENAPAPSVLADIAAQKTVRLTTPVRADGYDPLGDDRLLDQIPSGVRRVLIAGHSAYLTETEEQRAVAPRFRAARKTAPDAWVGTEGVERLALAAGGVQFELLSATTERDIRALRSAGYDGTLAVYAPTVLTESEDAVLDAVGEYASRRGPVSRELPTDAITDASATGRTREILSRAVREYALVGEPARVRQRVGDLRAAGADIVVGYPARDVGEFCQST